MKKPQPPPLEFNSLKHFPREKILIPEEFEPHLKKPQSSQMKKINYFESQVPLPEKKISIP